MVGWNSQAVWGEILCFLRSVRLPSSLSFEKFFFALFLDYEVLPFCRLVNAVLPSYYRQDGALSHIRNSMWPERLRGPMTHFRREPTLSLFGSKQKQLEVRKFAIPYDETFGYFVPDSCRFLISMTCFSFPVVEEKMQELMIWNELVSST